MCAALIDQHGLLSYLHTTFQCNWHGLHGVAHWERVADYGLVLGQIYRLPKEDLLIIQLFSYLHDSCRPTVVIPSTCITSSIWENHKAFSERSCLASVVSLPWTKCALPILSLPSKVLGPDPLPPWNWHFCVLLDFSAGLPHWFFVRLDKAVHLKQVIDFPPVWSHFLKYGGWFIIQKLWSNKSSKSFETIIR